jgi:hypothetical protein
MELTFTEMDDFGLLGSNDLTNGFELTNGFDLTNDLDLTNDSYATYFDKPKNQTTNKNKNPTKQINANTNQTKQINQTNPTKQINANPTNPTNLKSALKKPAVSFDDILNNMNLTLMDGKLVFAPPPNKKSVQINDYPSNPNPLTKEQLLKKKLIDYANYRNELIMASKIKSTRLQFTNNNNPTIHTRQTAAFNRIFALKK